MLCLYTFALHIRLYGAEFRQSKNSALGCVQWPTLGIRQLELSWNEIFSETLKLIHYYETSLLRDVPISFDSLEQEIHWGGGGNIFIKTYQERDNHVTPKFSNNFPPMSNAWFQKSCSLTHHPPGHKCEATILCFPSSEFIFILAKVHGSLISLRNPVLLFHNDCRYLLCLDEITTNDCRYLLCLYFIKTK
jgi:hypothetical protein